MVNRLTPGPGVAEGRIIAIVRSKTGAHLQDACLALVDAGIRAIEVTSNTPGAVDAIRMLADRGVEVGMGTVRTTADARAAADAGATFLVTPALSLDVGAAAAAEGLRWYPGAMTPTEIETAWQAGATAVKVFPAAALGGPAYLREVRAPLDDVPLVPTGGVRLDHIADYAAAGAYGVGLGSPLLGDAVDTGHLAALAARAAQAIEAARSLR